MSASVASQLSRCPACTYICYSVAAHVCGYSVVVDLLSVSSDFIDLALAMA